MAFTILSVMVATVVWTVKNVGASSHERSAIQFESRTARPFTLMSDSEDDTTKMQVMVVLLVAFCVSLAITVIIRFLRRYSERQRLYSSFS